MIWMWIIYGILAAVVLVATFGIIAGGSGEEWDQ